MYGGVDGDHYSKLTQIDRNNVAGLQTAWEFDTGEKGAIEVTPLVIGNVLFAFTPSLKVIALNASSGKLLWKFDSGIPGTQPSRGLSFWSNGKQARLFAGIMNYVYALDPATGRPVSGFGDRGRIDLRDGLGRDPARQEIALTSPGVIYKNFLIVGGMEPETHPAPPGDIRAFDVRTGRQRWAFHTIPHPGEYGYETWPTGEWKHAGGANNWAGMTLDSRRGIVYVPTGSAVSDFYGADRVGKNLFADSLIALDAATGRRVWSFQEVHHDIWDRDLPAAPALVRVMHDGRSVDAIAQTSKQGYIFLFDRSTGAPLFPVREKKYPASSVPGERSWPTQPLPSLPRPFARQVLTSDMLTTRTPAAHAWAEKQFAKFRSAGQFVPLGVNAPTVVFPGFDGGAEWGGPAVDPESGILFVNSNEMAWTGELVRETETASPGESIYRSQCAVCHGQDMAGAPPAFPSLRAIGKKLSPRQIETRIVEGGGRMPAFSGLDSAQLTDLVNYLTGQTKGLTGSETNTTTSAGAAREGNGYQFTGYHEFLDPEGYPAIAPPWGTLNAIDLNTGRYLWKVPLGEYPALASSGLRNTGSENYGGPVLTAGGVLFIGATAFDRKFRAFDSATGRLLWSTVLPAAGAATPATYTVSGKQFVVIAAGGSKRDSRPSEAFYVAFSLPQSSTQ